MLRSSRPIKMKSSDWWAHRPWQPGSGHGKGQENGLNHLSFRLNLKKSYLSYLTFDVRVLIYIYIHTIYIYKDQVKKDEKGVSLQFSMNLLSYPPRWSDRVGMRMSRNVWFISVWYNRGRVILQLPAYFSRWPTYCNRREQSLASTLTANSGSRFWILGGEAFFFKGLGHIFWVQTIEPLVPMMWLIQHLPKCSIPFNTQDSNSNHELY